MERKTIQRLTIQCVLLLCPMLCCAGAASQLLPVRLMLTGGLSSPVANAAFVPGSDALPAPSFAGSLELGRSPLQTSPILERPIQQGRDARLCPGVTLEFFTLNERLVPVQRGEMVREGKPLGESSYWRVIPQIGRIWREKDDGDWSRAAFPLMFVNDTENLAHQALATFLYRRGTVSHMMVQLVQQTAPYLLGQHFVAWGRVPLTFTPSDNAALESRRAVARKELAERLPAKPWAELLKTSPPHALDDFGGPLYPKWRVAAALVRDGTLYYQESETPFGAYPYPLEMRFGPRSVMKSVAVPLALLRLAQVYGPWVLTLKIGDFVPGLHPKWNRVRFIDAADMGSGFGGTGSLKTNPNNPYDGYLEGNYDAWYVTPTHAGKIAQINANLRPYPWEPGTVMRYRDQDFYLTGAAIDAFLKSMRGPQADWWEMLRAEVFEPIGIRHAPAVRTRESAERDGLVWGNAGYYPSLDDLAKIALLYQARGAHDGQQLLNRQLTSDLLAARDALQKDGDASLTRLTPSMAGPGIEFYKMGFHFIPYLSKASHQLLHLPTMSGSGENEVTLYPNGMVSIIMAKAAMLPNGEQAGSDAGPQTIRAVERLAPF